MKPKFDPARHDENPALTDEQLATMRPARDVLDARTFEALTRRPGQRGPQKTPTKQAVKLRLDPTVVEHFKAGGPGWQSRINAALVEVVKKTG